MADQEESDRLVGKYIRMLLTAFPTGANSLTLGRFGEDVNATFGSDGSGRFLQHTAEGYDLVDTLDKLRDLVAGGEATAYQLIA